MTLAARAVRLRKELSQMLKLDKLFGLGLGIIITYLLAASLAPLVAPYPSHADGDTSSEILQEPNSRHLFGTTDIGRDIFSVSVFGIRTSIMIGLGVVVTATTFGLLLGLVAGYVGGFVDHAIMRVTDVFLSFPSLMLALIIASTLGPGFNTVLVSLIATFWMWHARLARSQTLIVKNMPYIVAAKAMGLGSFRILFTHVLPNVVRQNLVLSVGDVGTSVLAAAGLSFLGLGLLEPTPDLGLLVAKSRAFFPANWWYAIFPGITLLILVVGFVFIGDAFRERMDPRLRSLRLRLGARLV
jgi:peptide/nickel transport system permease protein